MAINTRQKRMAALNHGCPWRGPLVDAAPAGFGLGERAATIFLYLPLAEEVFVPQIPPVGPTGRVYDNRDPPPRKLPPTRRRVRKRRRVPVPVNPAPTPQEIEAAERARTENVASRFGEDGALDQQAIEAGRALVGLPDPNAVARPPRIDFQALADEMVAEEQRMREEEEVEILLMAM